MDNRKWEADAIVSPPTAPVSPSDGYPTNGDPLSAQNATEPGAWWFHAIGEELRALIIEGGLTPDISTLTQLRDAVKNIAKGGDYKQSVRIASTANIAALSGLAAIDGVTPIAGDRILVKDQSTASQNGIYVAAAGAWTRSTDADTGAEFNGSAIVPVEEGTVNADTNWQLTNNGTVTIGTTGLTFECIETKFFTGSNQSLSSNGYQKLPAGFIIQWGGQLVNASASLTINFPIAFPNVVYQAVVTHEQAAGSGNLAQFSLNTSGVGVVNQFAGSITARYIAIGR
jgi:hypothetical protein